MEGKIYTPLPPPDRLYAKNPQPPLTEKERGTYDQVYGHFAASDYKLPGVEKGQLSEDEKFWLSYECILRFLRATKWKAPATVLRLEATLKWRREFGLYDLVTADHVEPEAVTGKEILFGHDTRGRPAFYMIPSRQNTDEATRQIQYAVWMLERCIDLMPPGVETLDILINFADRAKNPSMSTSRTVLSILQNHYPERLGLSLIINVPLLINAFFKIILPFVDPITREKIKFNPQVLKDRIFTPDSLMTEWWGGARSFEYEHAKYWPELVKLAEGRVKSWKESWKELGGAIGIREWDYKKVKHEEGEAAGDEGAGDETNAEGDTENGAVEIDDGYGSVASDQESCKVTRDKGEQNVVHDHTHDAGSNTTRATPAWVDAVGTSGNDYRGGNSHDACSNGPRATPNHTHQPWVDAAGSSGNSHYGGSSGGGPDHSGGGHSSGGGGGDSSGGGGDSSGGGGDSGGGGGDSGGGGGGD